MPDVQNQSQVVMLLEPDARIRSGLEVALRRHQFEVRTASDARDALEGDPASIALTECELGKANSFELCRRLLANGQARVVVMMSARPTRDMVLEAVRAGALEFVAKPADAEMLYVRLRKAYARSISGSKWATTGSPEIDFGGKPVSTARKVDIVMKRAATVRALPYAVGKILQLVAANNSDANDLGQAVESDPSIAAMVLKRARSAYYSRGNPVSDLRQAVVRIGFKECADLVISLSVFRLFSNDDKTFGFTRIGFWLHSISCGLLAKMVASQAGIEQAEKALMVGLLHDIGKMILDDLLTEEFQIAVRTAATKRQTLFDAELATLERTHAVVGAAVVERWRFPALVGEIILDHHQHEKFVSGSTQPPSLAGAVYLANLMSKAVMVGQAGDFLAPDVPEAVWRSYGFDGPPTREFLDRFFQQLEEYCAFLEIPESDLAAYLDRPQTRGTALVFDPTGKNTLLTQLFLLGQGYEARTVLEPAGFASQEDSVQLCLLRPDNAQVANEIIAAIEDGGGECPPTICILPEGVATDALGQTPPWLRTASSPIDFFELRSRIAELTQGDPAGVAESAAVG